MSEDEIRILVYHFDSRDYDCVLRHYLHPNVRKNRIIDRVMKDLQEQCGVLRERSALIKKWYDLKNKQRRCLKRIRDDLRPRHEREDPQNKYSRKTQSASEWQPSTKSDHRLADIQSTQANADPPNIEECLIEHGACATLGPRTDVDQPPTIEGNIQPLHLHPFSSAVAVLPPNHIGLKTAILHERFACLAGFYLQTIKIVWVETDNKQLLGFLPKYPYSPFACFQTLMASHCLRLPTTRHQPWSNTHAHMKKPIATVHPTIGNVEHKKPTSNPQVLKSILVS
ncbi:uncharacterized protein [Hyperolius riggenbachi]|uniref:uncharacterized protein n=1 Tax=Hyperolius riggenbachi TaxID=752182 RepID=UPI0035A38221